MRDEETVLMGKKQVNGEEREERMFSEASRMIITPPLKKEGG